MQWRDGTDLKGRRPRKYSRRTLPYGKYDLHETQNADGDDVDIWFTLTVNADGAGYEWEEEPGKKAIKNTIDAES